jgi:mono/diheme cytochrome c family protein
MKRFLRLVAFLLFLVIVAIAGVMLVLQGRGVSARPEPSGIEKRAALFMRAWMTPATYKGLKSPVSPTEENFIAGREHFADHCTPCHGNDGGGDTEMGRGLYPKAPDMRLARTQNLSDGELFYIIENGVKLTGMPAWSTGTPEGEKSTWQLVTFIRRLPKLTDADIEAMKPFNPTSRAQIEQERQEQEFLNGGDPPPAPDSHAEHRHPQ